MKCNHCGMELESKIVPFSDLIDEGIEIKYLSDEKGVYGALLSSVGGIIYVDFKFPAILLDAVSLEEKESIFDIYKLGLRNSKMSLGNTGTQFIFIYVNSEMNYCELLNLWGDKVMECAKEGMQFISPLAMAQKLNLIKLSNKKFGKK